MVDVLVPVDGSASSDNALEYAFDLFPDAKVHIVHVTSFPTEPTATAVERAQEQAEEVIKEAKLIADDYDQPIKTETIHGNAAKAIIRYAEQNDIDHIVMGSKGRSGVQRVLLGSVAETVVRRSPTPVTIVREG
ncbi:MAG: universal stress protein [Halorubrum sp.]